ncbi:MAG: type II toxin-antitoxin system VapC family toxin [Anaerolineales bacterium]|nr:type II toxin-antitoxin system VapC family toxin [Anaerolineales bacterium]
MFILDTNTIIYFFKGMGNVSTRMLSTPPNEIGISSIVLYELKVGIAKSGSLRRKAQLDSLISSIHVLPFSHHEATIAAQVRANLEKQGQPIGPYDILIAATAMAHNAFLITHNTKEFKRIEGLNVQDWY